MSFSGIADFLEVEAYLHGLMPLDSYQEDKLAHAVNERLEDLYRAVRVPYSTLSAPDLDPADPIAVVIDELLQEAKRARDETGP